MGTFGSIIDHVLGTVQDTDADTNASGRRAAGARRVVIQVIAVHGAEDLPLGAERAFDVVGAGSGSTLRPLTLGARQIRSRRERRRLSRLLEDDIGS